MDSWGYLFNTSDYNPATLLNVLLKCSSFGQLVQLSPVCLLTYPLIVIFFISFLISDTARGSSCISPVPVDYDTFLQGVLVPRD